MDLGIRGKRAIVTGGASNIGRAISRGLAEEGADIAILDIDVAAAERTAAGIEADFGTRAAPYRVDVSDREAVAEAVEKAVAGLGGLELLVNCAGGPSQYRHFLEKSYADFERDISINLWGTINSTRAAAPHLMARGGRIVNIASDTGRMPYPGCATYAAAKGGIIAMTRTIALDLAPKVTINSVCPSFSVPSSREEYGEESRWGKGGGFEYWTEERTQEMVKTIPMGRAGTGEDIANTVVFLLSDRSSYVTGQTWSINGGMSML